MKKAAAVLAAVAMVVSMVSLVFAAETSTVTTTVTTVTKMVNTVKGAVTHVNAKEGTLELKDDSGKEVKLTVDKAVDLGKLKKKDEVEVSVNNGMVTSLKVTKKAKAAMGC